MSVKEALSNLNDWCSCGEMDVNFSNVPGETFFFISVTTSFDVTLAFIRGIVTFTVWFCFLFTVLSLLTDSWLWYSRINFGIEIRGFLPFQLFLGRGIILDNIKFIIIIIIIIIITTLVIRRMFSFFICLMMQSFVLVFIMRHAIGPWTL